MSETLPTNETLLEVKGLSIHAGATALVQDLDFAMQAGERIGLIGESGSGKSLTATALLGLLPDELRVGGDARLRGVGHNLLTAPDKVMRSLRGDEISMVFQEPLTALNPLMQVGAQVAEVMTQHRTVPNRSAAARRAVELLASVRIPDPAVAARAYPHQLSGGQRQRVMVAMALANDPQLLLCDEPTTALDVTVQRQVLDLVSAQVRERGTGLLFITHDLAVVASMCTRVLVLNRGRIVESGQMERVFSAPAHPYTRALLAASDLAATDDRGRLFTVSTAGTYVPPVPGEEPARTPTLDQAAAPEQLAVSAQPTPERVSATAPLISVSGLNRTYHRARTTLRGPRPEVRALRDVDFTLGAGERLGIVGESGSGKSTLLRILAGLDQPTSGSAVVAGTEVAGAKENRLAGLRRQLQIVFQDPMGSLDPRMRVKDIVGEPLLVPGQPLNAAQRAAKVAEMLLAVGLDPESAERFPHQFSGGQRQRISIARALICRPRVLVADEPVSALDVSVRAQVLNLLADLVDEYALTLLFVSHDLAVVRHLCDRVIVMKDGEIVEAGQTEDVYNNPRHPYTRELIASSLNLREQVAES
ncbi:dipeptide ABC transporter ATP-binding protein [Paeniglutamicibacter kerguelensis]|uniref:Peptide/nickel transport system ATP-binding protein n=1 Tax=Paeniglutamicibacter kerguelensis TaxID=254788 RepID=A0ABS4X8K6_9MICC|nr:ABC transporter ATP-binding protein [Paeniglutamicibacter kerguelensis]MBP2384801.1 peptide/nickel transport system ATP-binding protein [Paeniglutamicibacter kerguelensis]